MPRTCSVCGRAERNKIDQALLRWRAVTEHSETCFGIGHQSVSTQSPLCAIAANLAYTVLSLRRLPPLNSLRKLFETILSHVLTPFLRGPEVSRPATIRAELCRVPLRYEEASASMPRTKLYWNFCWEFLRALFEEEGTVIRGSPPGLLALAGAATVDAPGGRTDVSVWPLLSALNALVLLPATLSSGPVPVDSMPCAPFPCGPRPSMKADIPTLHKPDILILRRQWWQIRCA